MTFLVLLYQLFIYHIAYVSSALTHLTCIRDVPSHESVALLAVLTEPYRFISVFSDEYRDCTLKVVTATSPLISSSTMHASFTSYT
jgi:hypothetical protein